VAKKLYLVFSRPPERISEEEYLRWYEDHARENIESPGFVSTQRYSVRPSRGDSTPLTHLALYEYEGDEADWREHLERRIAEGEIVLPEWFDEITFESWDCQALTDRIEP
jgi:tRNA A37 threonylcarbamoyladenosine biosynthesis protein TsaE